MRYRSVSQRPDNFILKRDHPLAQGLVFAGLGAHAGSTRYHDSSVFGTHGTGVLWTPSTDWKYDDKLDRLGVHGYTGGGNHYVSHPRLSQLNNIAAFSISIWVKFLVASPGSNSYWGKWDEGDGVTQQFSRYNSGLQWFVRNGANTAEASITVPTATLTLPGLNHFCGVADGSNINIYHNGVYVTQAALAGPYIPSTSTGAWGIGYGRTNAADAYLFDPLYHALALTTTNIKLVADPSNVMLSGLIQPPKRRYYTGITRIQTSTRKYQYVIAGVGMSYRI